MKIIPFARLAVLLTLGAAPQAWAEFAAGADSFAGAPAIAATNEYSIATNLTTFTKEAQEPSHSPGSVSGAAKTAWWRWTAPESGFCTVDTRQTLTDSTAVLDTLLGVYTGATVGNLTAVAKNDDYSFTELAADGLYSSVTFYATAGQVYRFAVDAFDPTYVNANHFNVILRVRLLALKPMVRDAVWHLDDTADSTGSVTMAMTATGSLSGKLTVAGKAFPFKGYFDPRGYFQATFPRPAKPGQVPLPPLSLMIDGAGDLGQMSVDNGYQIFGNYFPRRLVFSPQDPNTRAGYFTFYSEAIAESAYCTGSMKVASNGTVKGVGTAFDGTPFTFGSALHASYGVNQNYLTAYASLYGNKGYMSFTGQISEGGAVDTFDAYVAFLRPAGSATAVFYPEGLFISSTSLKGGTYTKPQVNNRALGFLDSFSGDGLMVVTNAKNELELGDVSEFLNLDTKNKFTFDSLTKKPTLKLNPATGQVTGSVMEPGKKKRTIKGMLVKYADTLVLRGACSGTTQALRFSVVTP